MNAESSSESSRPRHGAKFNENRGVPCVAARAEHCSSGSGAGPEGASAALLGRRLRIEALRHRPLARRARLVAELGEDEAQSQVRACVAGARESARQLGTALAPPPGI